MSSKDGPWVFAGAVIAAIIAGSMAFIISRQPPAIGTPPTIVQQAPPTATLVPPAIVQQALTQVPQQVVVSVQQTPTMQPEDPNVAPVPTSILPTTSPTDTVPCWHMETITPQPYKGKEWTLPARGWIIANVYGPSLKDHKLLLGPNDPRVLLLGGSAWRFADTNCKNQTLDQFQNGPIKDLPEISLGELQKQGLIH